MLEPSSQQVMALVTGPGGIGKSTLVAQAITRRKVPELVYLAIPAS